MCAVAHLQCSATLISAKYSSPLLGTAVQHRLTAVAKYISLRYCTAIQADSRLVLLQKHLWRLALNTCVQWPTFSAVPH